MSSLDDLIGSIDWCDEEVKGKAVELPTDLTECREIMYQESISPAIAKCLIPSNAFDPECKYILMTQWEGSLCVKIDEKGLAKDPSHKDRYITEFYLEPEELKSDTAITDYVKANANNDVDDVESKSAHSRASLFICGTIALLSLIGFALIAYCLKFN